jgi:phosphocarrier protein HPr
MAMTNGSEPLTKDLLIINERGLHARAAARFVKTAEQFSAEITVSKDEHTVPARSIMSLLLLVAGRGSSIMVTATGEDGQEALNALEALVAARFDEAK